MEKDKFKEVEDRLIISFDGYSKDKACIIVARQEKEGLRVINQFYDKEAQDIYEYLSGIRTRWNYEEDMIPNFIYKGILYPDREDLFKKIETALGFKLFTWQKSFIETGIYRKYGETTARCLRELLAVDKPPLDFSKKPTHSRSEFYKHEMREIQQKLNKAGIHTRRVFWKESDKRKYYDS